MSSKIENWIKEYKLVLFIGGIAFGWLFMWWLLVTFAVIVL